MLPHIKAICGMHLIGEPPVEEDAERNTDLMVLRMEAVRIGCRIRKFQDLKYGGEFTLRASRPSGVKTELTKVIEGWGDYFFYGFANENADGLTQWVLADLRVFRVEFMRKLASLPAKELPGKHLNNHDNSSSFRVFKWAEFSPDLIVASSQIEKRGAA